MISRTTLESAVPFEYIMMTVITQVSGANLIGGVTGRS